MSSKTNTGYAGVTYIAGLRRAYQATNWYGGLRKKFYINSKRTREQAFSAALDYANK